jgi:GNAT superfamily N-acetyltransferase
MPLAPLPPGHVGAVVTSLAMTARPAAPPPPASPLRLVRWEQPDLARYRALFRAVGARWLWYSRLAMSEAALRAALGEVHAVVDQSGAEVGFLELEFAGSLARIRFLGLVPALAGRGHGRWLIDEALRLAWREGVERVELHTCTLDHPAALPAYLRAGFRAVGRAFESFPDPRLAGLLPRDCAPQVLLLS